MYFPATDRSVGAKLPTHDIRTFNIWSHCWIFLLWGSLWMGIWPLQPVSQILPTALFVNKVLLEPRHVHLSSMAAFSLQWKSWVVVTETIQPPSLKYLLIDPYRKCLPTPALDCGVCEGRVCFTYFCVSNVSFSHTAWKSLINISEVIEWIWVIKHKPIQLLTQELIH